MKNTQIASGVLREELHWWHLRLWLGLAKRRMVRNGRRTDFGPAALIFEPKIWKVFLFKTHFPHSCAIVGWLFTPDLPSSPDKLLSPNMETRFLIVNISQNTPLLCPMTLQKSSLNWMSAQIYSFTLKFIESWLHLNQGEPAVARFDSIGNHNFPQI